MVERTCQHCGEAYRTFPSIKPKYCSAACVAAAKRKGVEDACGVCGKPIYRQPCRPDHRFCSKSCARTASNLTAANPAFSRDVSGEKNPMHGVRISGAENPMFGKRKQASPRWKGGRRIRRDGYVFVVVPDDHPHPSYASKTGTKYLLEHRWVMEQHLGRRLEPGEVVHHIDGDQSNNVVDNLRLFASQADHMHVGHGSGV